uniref:Uncharacterized protein n=1 Tax=Panagrolaimus sp. ES5 TaxID=591445 RepID=A0AC34F7D1_9BILA
MTDSRIVFKKPSDDIDTVTTTVLEEREDGGNIDGGATSSIAVFNPYYTMSIQKQRSMLPIAKYKMQVLYAMERFRTVIIVGETGSGKSTQVPQFLMEAGWCSDRRLIGITQPRRVGAVTLATRVADEQLCRLGSKVGFVVRFGGVSSDETMIQYMTDGILLREMSSDPLLLRYSVIMVDEAHERSVNSDLLLALLRRLQKVRQDLRVIVSSATLDAAYFRQFFELNDGDDPTKDTAVIVSVEGSTYPVDIFYAENVIMVDEAHERSVNSDLLLALLRRLQKIRQDLRVIVSSATLDAAYFRQFFELNDGDDPTKDTAVIVSVEGSTYPVDIFYAEKPVPSYAKAALSTTIDIHTKHPSGDILIFLTGQDEVEALCTDLKEQTRKLKNCDKLWIVPLYGGLSQKEQLRAFDSTPFGTRKVVVATNIAETSVTIPGIS